MGFINGLGAESFTNGFLKAYTTLNEDARQREQADIINQLRRQQIEEMQRKIAVQNEMQAFIDQNRVPYVNDRGQFSDAGAAKLQGMLSDKLPGLSGDASAITESYAPAPDQGESAKMAVGNLLPEMTQQLQSMPGEKVRPTFEQLMPFVYKLDPEKAMQLEISHEDKKAQREATNALALARLQDQKNQNDINNELRRQSQEDRKWFQEQQINIQQEKKDNSRQVKMGQALSKVEEINAGMDNMIDMAKMIRDHKGLSRITGIMSKLPNMPGSEAANVQALLNTLKSQAGLNTLAALKAGTGAGLGQVTEAEHKLLQNYISALDNSQSTKEFKANLNRLIDFAEKSKQRMKSGYGMMYNENKPSSSSGADQYSTVIDAASGKFGVDSGLIKKVISVESRGNQNAISPKGAIGLMQLMPGTAKELGVDPNDPQQNIMGGAAYLAKMLRVFGGDKEKAVAAYNAGPDRVKKAMVAGDRWKEYLPSETQSYIKKVLGGGGVASEITLSSGKKIKRVG